MALLSGPVYGSLDQRTPRFASRRLPFPVGSPLRPAPRDCTYTLYEHPQAVKPCLSLTSRDEKKPRPPHDRQESGTLCLAMMPSQVLRASCHSRFQPGLLDVSYVCQWAHPLVVWGWYRGVAAPLAGGTLICDAMGWGTIPPRQPRRPAGQASPESWARARVSLRCETGTGGRASCSLEGLRRPASEEQDR